MIQRNTDDKGMSIVTAKTIYKDRKGKLWFGLNEGSAYAFDGQYFKRFTFSNINNQTIFA